MSRNRSNIPAASVIHPASLMSTTCHSPALLELVSMKMTRVLIDYVVDCVAETVRIALGSSSSNHTSPRGRSQARITDRVKLTDFVSRVITRANIKVATLLVALVYIDRATPFLHISTELWAGERVFLGALMVAYKYVNDGTLKNFRWAIATGVFGTRDVGRVEREYLEVLNYELNFTEDDILTHHTAITTLSHIPSAPSRSLHSASNRIPFPRGPSVSRWSDDSDDDDNGSEASQDDSELEEEDLSPSSSSSTGSLPRTPDIHSSIAVDPSSFLKFPSKRSFQSPPPPPLHPPAKPLGPRRPKHPAFRFPPLAPMS